MVCGHSILVMGSIMGQLYYCYEPKYTHGSYCKPEYEQANRLQTDCKLSEIFSVEQSLCLFILSFAVGATSIPISEMGVAHTVGLSQRKSRSKMVPTAHSIVHSGTAVPTRPSCNPFCTTTTGCLQFFDMTFITLWSTQIFYGW